MELFLKEFILGIIIGLLIILFGILFFSDKGLAVGLFLMLFLSGLTFLILYKTGFKDKGLYQLFSIALLIHLAAVLLIYFAGFRPVGGGADYEAYHLTATEISQRIKQGSFSLEGLHISHYFAVIIGILYLLTLPKMIIGQLLGVWLVALSVLFTYLIVLEIRGSKKWAFLIGLIVAVYPSYLYFGSLLLKDIFVVPLALAGILLCLKLLKDFRWQNFLIFYLILAGLTHFRFYVGYALLVTFIISWLFAANLKLRKRLAYVLIIIPLLGFVPQISASQPEKGGYYGFSALKGYLRPERITYYREVAYVPELVAVPETPGPELPIPETPSPETPSPETSVPEAVSPEKLTPSSPAKPTSPTQSPPLQEIGPGSTFTIETGLDNPLKFTKNYLKSFSYALLGPFPWQIRYQRQLIALVETIPWYFLFVLVIIGGFRAIKNKNYRFTLPLILFSLGLVGALAILINNFGILTRIRIPAFIVLLCLIPFAFEGKGLISKIYGKIPYYWRSRIHWLKPYRPASLQRRESYWIR